MSHIEIPTDMYESQEEIMIIVPLGGVAKETIRVRFVDGSLFIAGERAEPKLKNSFVPLEQQCYRGVFEKKLPLPTNIYYEKIHAECYTDNILVIVVPKMIIPEEVDYSVTYVPRNHSQSQISASSNTRVTFGNEGDQDSSSHTYSPKRVVSIKNEGAVQIEGADSFSSGNKTDGKHSEIDAIYEASSDIKQTGGFSIKQLLQQRDN